MIYRTHRHAPEWQPPELGDAELQRRVPYGHEREPQVPEGEDAAEWFNARLRAH